MTEASVVADFLVRSLQQVDPRPLKGSALAVLVKTAYPDFKPEYLGYRSLRDFIRQNAAEIMEFSKAGMDIVYRLRATQEGFAAESSSAGDSNVPVDQLTRNPLLWKTFASPGSAFRLYIDPQTGVLRSLHSNVTPRPEWREIPKITADALLQIGRDFTANLPDIQQSALAPLLKEPKWWIPYFERLQTLGLRSKWVEFRRRRILETFKRVIDQIGAVSDPAELAAHTNYPVPEHPGSRSELPIRKIAAEVVQRMTESELRALNLPLGYVIDCLTTR